MKLSTLLDPFYFEIKERKFEEGNAYIITSKADESQNDKLLIDRLNDFFIQHEFVQTTIELRNLQKRYYKGEKNLLGDCKSLEKKLDQLILNIEKYKSK